MKYLFIVQGEGRGHMTQAISLRNMLAQNGHEVTSVIIGKSSRREIPSFFFEKIRAKVHPVNSPNFVVGKKNKRIKITKSIIINLLHFRRYFKSLQQIKSVVKDEKPNVIINFYDLLGGLFYFFNNPKIPYYCIGHQYLLNHSEFPFPDGHKFDRFLLKINTLITSFRANKFLALSFRQMENQPKKKIYVVPPLLRDSVLELEPKNEGFIHGYMLNQGYAKEIMDWHKSHVGTKVYFFWDKKEVEEVTIIHKNLIFHKINDVKFLDYMSRCEAYASTAGFESICEAMYLGKPIMMVPTAGHFEQKCNAIDAKISGAGIWSDEFDLTKLLNYIPNHSTDNSVFKKWVDSAEQKFLAHLNHK